MSGELVVSYAYDAWGKVLYTSGTLADTVGAINPMRYRDYYLDSETGYYYLRSRYYDPNICRFINADEPNVLILNFGNITGANLFAYCNNNPIMNLDRTGLLSIPAWTVSAAIDGIILGLAGWLKATWMGFMAPIKMMGKKAAAAYFAKNIAWRVKGISNSIIQVGVKALAWIGKKAFAATFNLGAKAAISAIINEPLRVVTACTSIGGAIAAVWDYLSDKKFNGWIRLW